MSHITPTIGRIVLHRGNDKQIRPAIVTHVWGEFSVSLEVFPKGSSDTEAGTRVSVTHADPEQEPGCLNSWHWMPYQKQQAAAGTSVHAAPPATSELVKPNTITAAQVADLIARSTFTDAKLGDKTTVVCMKLPNGYEIVEASSCVDPANYNHAMGVQISKERMVNRVWQLEGYRLQCELAKV